jgi:D-glycero-alpha-D-manno-heptose-7-phosphate kinase
MSGGGSDYKSYFEKYGGAVVGGTINKRVHVFINHLSALSDENIRFTYRQTESVQNVDQIDHPVVREALRFFQINKEINVATMADLPGRSGLGSSSAFTVALVGGLAQYCKIHLTRLEISQIAIEIDREILGEPGGIQDHLQSTFGGFRLYEFSKAGFKIHDSILNQNLSNISSDKMLLLRYGSERESALLARKTDEAGRSAKYVPRIKESAILAVDCYNKIKITPNIEDVGNILASTINDNWNVKKIFQETQNSQLDLAIEELREKGVKAVKVCGAGESGFLLLFGDEIVVKRITKESSPEKIVKFNFTDEGLSVREF